MELVLVIVTYMLAHHLNRNKLFAYGIGSGIDDPVLGFPLTYSSIDNIGDISFDVSLNSSSFNYVSGTIHYTKS